MHGCSMPLRCESLRKDDGQIGPSLVPLRTDRSRGRSNGEFCKALRFAFKRKQHEVLPAWVIDFCTWFDTKKEEMFQLAP